MRELQNAYPLGKIGADTTESELTSVNKLNQIDYEYTGNARRAAEVYPLQALEAEAWVCRLLGRARCAVKAAMELYQLALRPALRRQKFGKF